MAGGTSLVINPSEWPNPLNGVAQVPPCSTVFATKSRWKREGEKNGSIYAQFGTIENRLALNPPNNGHEFGFLASVAGAAITVGCVYVWAGRHISSVWLGGGEIV